MKQIFKLIFLFFYLLSSGGLTASDKHATTQKIDQSSIYLYNYQSIIQYLSGDPICELLKLMKNKLSSNADFKQLMESSKAAKGIGGKAFGICYKHAKHLIDDVAKLEKLIDDLAANPALIQFLDNSKMLKAWEGLINIPTLRKNIDWLTRSSKWIDEGAEFVTTNGITKLRKGADDILEIKNEKILPSKYDFDPVTQKPNPNGTPVGEPSNGYQVYKNGNDLSVRRVPETGGYDPQSLSQLTGPNAHPNCHVLERHGHDVTDDALIKRATTRPSVAPDGSTMNNPPDYSSKFDSPEKVVEGMNNTKQGTPAWNAGQQQGSRRVVEYESSNIVGKGVPRDGNSFVTTKKVFAVYEDTGGGTYKLITMYPSF